MVCCIVLHQFVHDTWTLSLLLCRYVFNYGSLQSQVVKWQEGPLNPMSIFWVTRHWCLYGVIWESILIGMAFQNFDGISILIKSAVPLLCKFQCEVPVKTYFFRNFSKTLYMRPKASGLVVPSLKTLVYVVGFLRMFLLLDIYHVYRHKYRQ